MGHKVLEFYIQISDLKEIIKIVNIESPLITDIFKKNCSNCKKELSGEDYIKFNIFIEEKNIRQAQNILLEYYCQSCVDEFQNRIRSKKELDKKDKTNNESVMK